jgi:hypothetical protein
MGLVNKIEKVRQKPEDVRKKYAVLWAGISMIFIVAIWFISMRGAQPPKPDEEKIRQDQLYQEIGGQKKSLEDSLKEMGDSYKNIKDIQSEMMKQAEEAPQSESSTQDAQSLEGLLNQEASGPNTPTGEAPTQEAPVTDTPSGDESYSQ